MITVRINWPALVTDIAFVLGGNWRSHWLALKRALHRDGSDVPYETGMAPDAGSPAVNSKELASQHEL